MAESSNSMEPSAGQSINHNMDQSISHNMDQSINPKDDQSAATLQTPTKDRTSLDIHLTHPTSAISPDTRGRLLVALKSVKKTPKRAAKLIRALLATLPVEFHSFCPIELAGDFCDAEGCIFKTFVDPSVTPKPESSNKPVLSFVDKLRAASSNPKLQMAATEAKVLKKKPGPHYVPHGKRVISFCHQKLEERKANGIQDEELRLLLPHMLLITPEMKEYVYLDSVKKLAKLHEDGHYGCVGVPTR